MSPAIICVAFILNLQTGRGVAREEDKNTGMGTKTQNVADSVMQMEREAREEAIKERKENERLVCQDSGYYLIIAAVKYRGVHVDE